MKQIRSTFVLICVLATFLNAVFLRAADKSEKSRAHQQAVPYKNIGVQEFDKLRQAKTNIVLDVRTPKEYAAGHIPGAILIDFNSSDFESQIAKLDKNKTYLVHCAVGGRSAKACSKLEKLNFATVYNLEGGMKAWEKAAKPVEKSK